jgi:hypothetical protein
MKKALLIPIILVLMAALVNPTPALSEYQRGVLEGLNRGWNMAQIYDQAKAGDTTGYNQAIPIGHRLRTFRIFFLIDYPFCT